MNSKHIYSYSLTGLITASIAAFIIGITLCYALGALRPDTASVQGAISQEEYERLEEELEETKLRADSTREQLIEAQKLNSHILETLGENGNETQNPYAGDTITLINPKGGESLCIGETVPIMWEGSTDLSTVQVMIKSPLTGGIIGNAPASSDETGQKNGKGVFVWKVGTLTTGAQLPQDATYEITVEGNFSAQERAQGRPSVRDYSDNLISLVVCEG